MDASQSPNAYTLALPRRMRFRPTASANHLKPFKFPHQWPTLATGPSPLCWAGRCCSSSSDLWTAGSVGTERRSVVIGPGASRSPVRSSVGLSAATVDPCSRRSLARAGWPLGPAVPDALV